MAALHKGLHKRCPEGRNSRKSVINRGTPPHPRVPTLSYIKKGLLSFLYMSRVGVGGVGCRQFLQPYREIPIVLGLFAVICHAAHSQATPSPPSTP